MGRTKGASQGTKLSAYAKKTDTTKKRRKKVTAWGYFSLEKVDPLPKYNR